MLAGSMWRKVVVTLLVVAGLMWLYEATTSDSRYMARVRFLTETDPAEPRPAPPGVRLVFTATAYCKGEITSAGVAPRRGVAAGDPTILPLGTIIEIDSADNRLDGVYSVLDTGPEIQGRRIDLYMWSCNEALAFGRQTVRLTVLRMGWNPRATTRSFMDRLFRPEPPEDPDPEPPPPAPPSAPADLSVPAPEPASQP
ncbi:MAG: 3D domain-containing protein [Vicinamibacterales bacterium]